jgi:carbonic anhydrase
VRSLQHLLENNRNWADRVTSTDRLFFERLAAQQAPEYLWIGCSDSRVPANEIVDLLPGELFVHRNVANVVVHTDLNCLSVLQFAIDVLKVRHVLVVGHYGCGGVRAALENGRFGLIDNWLRHVQDVRQKHHTIIDACEPDDRLRRLCELNVLEQALNVIETTIVQDAWQRGQPVTVHGWCYDLHDGLVRDLDFAVSENAALGSAHAAAVRQIAECTAGPRPPTLQAVQRGQSR